MVSATPALSLRSAVTLLVVSFALAAAPAVPGRPFPSVVLSTDDADSTGGMTTFDLDGDGMDDLAVAIFAKDEVLMLQGDGPSPSPVGPRLSVGDGPFSLAAGDINGDGVQDLAVLNFRSADLSILLGRGDGGFEPERRRAFLQGAPDNALDLGATRSMALADLDGDDILDLAAINGTDVSLLRGLGDGDFAPWGRVTAGGRPAAIVAGDFDADGRADLATTNLSPDEIVLLLGRGDGTFDAQTPVPAGILQSGLAAADLDGNGSLDLVTANQNAGDPLDSSAGDVSVLLGSGDGGFSPAVHYRAGKATTRVAPGDFDHDGRIDIAAGNSVSGDASILLGAGDGTFGPEQRVRIGPSPLDLDTVDFDGDGHLDLAATIGRAGVSCVNGLGDGSFGPQASLDMIVRPNSVAAADFDGDGRQDLIVIGSARFPETSDVALFPGLGDGGFENPVYLDIGEIWADQRGVAVADFDRDGAVDFALSDGVRSIGLVRGLGGWAFGPASWQETGYQPMALNAADFNGDGRQDLAVAHQYNDGVLILLGRGDGGFDPGTRLAAEGSFEGLVTSDFDADGAVDIALVGGAVRDQQLGYRDSVLIWMGIGDGRFRDPIQRDVANSPAAIASGDLNGDSLQDLLVASAFEITLLLGQGPAGFAPGVVRPGPWFMTGIVAADFTRDGLVDAAVLSDQWETVSVFPGLNDGTLGSEMRSAAGRRPVACTAGDFDADGDPDLVTADMGLRDAWLGSLPDLYLLLNRTPAPNRAPIAVAMAPAAVECSSWDGAVVRLDGSASRDPDSRPGETDDLATFAWYEDYGAASQTLLGSGPVVDVTLGLGAHAITLVVTDRTGLSDSAATTVTVQDTVPPSIELRRIAPAVLWPPDHRMVDVEVTVDAIDRCGPAEVALQSVTSSEADDAPGSGDGHTTGDVRGADVGRPDFAFKLRAERSGMGEGRRYTAIYRARDDSGHSADAAIVVEVPAAGGPSGGP